MTGTNVAALKVTIPALQMSEDELVKVLSTSLYPGAAIESIKLVVGWCKAQNKDPMKRPVHIVPMQVKEKKRDGSGTTTVWRDVLMPGIGDYRTDAARSGEYAGIGDAKYGSEITETLGGEPKKEWDERARAKVDTGKTYDKLEFKYPEWCEISVYRLVHGNRCEFSSGRVYFKEIYATAGNETSLPNAMWKKRPRGQLEKCAEAMALRRAFPEVGAQPTADELEGKVLEEAAHPAIEGSATVIVEQPNGAGAETATASEAAKVATAAKPAGDAVEKKDDKPMQDGQKRILRAKLANAALNDVDLNAAFSKKLGDGTNDPGSEGWMFSDFQKVQEWIATKTK